LKGKTVVVTGGNSGIGFETARVLTSVGARVVVTTRDEKKARETEQLIKATQPHAQIEGMVCALDSLKSIRAFGAAYAAKKFPLDLLILNAGIMACPLSYTEDKFETQFGVNHIGHFAVTKLLLPIMKASKQPGRIVVLSSGAHRRSNVNLDDPNFIADASKYDPWRSYGASKTANILFAKHLNAMLKAEHVPITVNAVHPGVIETNLGRHLGPNLFKLAPAKVSNDAKAPPAPPLFVPRMKTMSQGAATTLVAALVPHYGTTGGLYLADCAPQKPLAYASDMKAAERLWMLTEKLLAGK